MMKVRYVPSGDLSFSELTIGGVYDVLPHSSKFTIRIIDDAGNNNIFFRSDENGIAEFIDVTTEYRSEIIDSILC